MAEQEFRQLKAGVTGDTYDGDGFGRCHFSKASIFCWSAARVFLLAEMMRTVSSPAMVPAISGNLDASTAAASGCAPLGGVFRTRRFSAGRTSMRNSRRARASGPGERTTTHAESVRYEEETGDATAQRYIVKAGRITAVQRGACRMRNTMREGAGFWAVGDVI